jgi:hypothetical protein
MLRRGCGSGSSFGETSRSLDGGDDTTKISTVRRSRKCGSPHRFHPGAWQRRGWRWSGRQGASGELRLVNLLRKRAKRGCHKVRQEVGRWLGPSGGADTVGGVEINDRRRRRLRILMRNLVGLGRFLRERRKGSEGGVLGPFIGGLAWGGG